MSQMLNVFKNRSKVKRRISRMLNVECCCLDDFRLTIKGERAI